MTNKGIWLDTEYVVFINYTIMDKKNFTFLCENKYG